MGKVLLVFITLTINLSVVYANYYGPYHAEVIRVIDGDTIEVRAYIWPGLEQVIKVRLAEINTPELRSKIPCEKELAYAARDYVNTLISNKNVILRDVKLGKYAGRVVADIYHNEQSLSQLLLLNNYAHPMGDKSDWCE